MTACVSVSDRCRPPVFGNDEGSVIDDLTVPEEQTHLNTHTQTLTHRAWIDTGSHNNQRRLVGE